MCIIVRDTICSFSEEIRSVANKHEYEMNVSGGEVEQKGIARRNRSFVMSRCKPGDDVGRGEPRSRRSPWRCRIGSAMAIIFACTIADIVADCTVDDVVNELAELKELLLDCPVIQMEVR